MVVVLVMVGEKLSCPSGQEKSRFPRKMGKLDNRVTLIGRTFVFTVLIIFRE